MKIHHLTADEALASLQSGAEGLTQAEAERRLAEFGPNRMERLGGESLLRRLAAQFTHFFAVILWVAAALAFAAEARQPGEGMRTLAFAIIGVIVVNGLFSFWQEERAQQTLEALQRLLPREVRVLRDAAVRVLPAAALVPGDLILLEGGNEVPADCRLLEAFAVRVNVSTVTGESLPKSRNAAPSDAEDILSATNVLLAGTSLVGGTAKALVFHTGMHSEFGKIAHLTQATSKVESPLRVEIARLSRWIAVLAAALGAVFFLIGQALGLPTWQNLLFAIGIIVANVPEGLLPTVTLALAIGAQRMSRRKALIRHLPSVETLGATTVICSDKTGTLTRNRLTVRQLVLDGAVVDVTPELLGTLRDRHPHVIEVAALCHTLRREGPNGSGAWIGDTLEVALAEMAERGGAQTPGWARRDEIPFDSERRRMSVLYDTPAGPVLYAKGALENILPLCDAFEVEGRVQPLDDASRTRLLGVQDEMARGGLRVLGLATRRMPDAGEIADRESAMTLCGMAALEDPPRPEVPEAIARCHEAGIRVIMVTGDHPRTAEAVARRIGLVRTPRPSVVTGPELGKMSNTQLQIALAAPEILFARITADQKRRIVAVLKRRGEIVAVTGDGVNDAPALREAHIGIAMGVYGSDVAKEAADMVLLDDNFASIVAAIEEGRTVFDNIRKFLTYILTSNIPELVPYVAYAILPIPLALTIIQVLAVDLGTDMVPALALGAEASDPAVMKRPPRALTKRLVDGPLVRRAYLVLGPLEAAAGMGMFLWVLVQGGWHYGVRLGAHDPLYLEATTACLAAIVVMQVANVFLCRSDRHLLFGARRPFNALLFVGVGTELVLIAAIAYTSWGNSWFGTAPLPGKAWLLMLPFAAAMVLVEQVRVLFTRNRSVGG